MVKFVLFYGKYSIDRKKQIKNHGTFFGVASDNLEFVKERGIEIAREHPNLIIIPKAFPLNDTLDTIALDAQEHFETFGKKLQKAKI